MSAEPSKSTASSPWPARAQATAEAIGEWVTRPRVTLCLVGVVLAFGGLLLTDSVWTLPLVIVGAVMVVVAWIGHRLEGRFAVEWGKAGTELAFRATVKPARGAVALVGVSAAEAQPDRLEPAASSENQVIEGEAHTVEVDVGELKALIAAVEAEPSSFAAQSASYATESHETESHRIEGHGIEAHEIRVHRVVNGNRQGPDRRVPDGPH